jgi:Fe-S-cluster-containing dehydrogenase component
MARYAIIIDYDFCTGCHSCEVACQQEHQYPVGTNGVVVKEYEYEAAGRVKIDFMPFLTDHCDFCTARLARSERPACVKHCQASCMEFGMTQDIANTMKDRTRAVLYTHVPGKGVAR